MTDHHPRAGRYFLAWISFLLAVYASAAMGYFTVTFGRLIDHGRLLTDMLTLDTEFSFPWLMLPSTAPLSVGLLPDVSMWVQGVTWLVIALAAWIGAFVGWRTGSGRSCDR